MVHFIQLVLPLYQSEQEPAPADTLHAIVKAELTRHFGRCDAHTRTPDQGRWTEGGKGLRQDLVIYEVMSMLIDEQWWEWYQQVLEERFRRVEVVIRTLPMI
ncbi:hypothetical protein [Prosthecobacter sp.]|uniref:hypothetical protein n=1 Tax=Prosthecobacter sp. TaxID=1965333 RepID=UPI003783044A